MANLFYWQHKYNYEFLLSSIISNWFVYSNNYTAPLTYLKAFGQS